MREVQLLIELQLPEHLLALFVLVGVVEADIVEDKIAEGRVHQRCLALGLFMHLDLLLSHKLHLFDHLAHELLVYVRLTHALIHFLHESLAHLNVFLLVRHRYVVLNLTEVLPVWLQTPLKLFSILQRALLLELVNLFKERNALDATLFGIVAQMTQTVFDANSDLNHFLE